MTLPADLSLPKHRVLVFIQHFLPGYKAGGPIRSLANLVAALETTFNSIS